MRQPQIFILALWLSLVPSITQADEVLTLRRAIELAIQNNLTTQLAKATTLQARGQTLQAAGGLLPKLTASVSQSRTFKVNLEASGFPANGFFNPLIGPFNTFDARLTLAQSLLDFNAIWRGLAGITLRRVAEQQERLAREQVASAAALAYIEAQRTTQAVDAASADVALANSLLKLARDQHRAGVSTGVDVARSETSAAQENLRLIRAKVAANEALVRLQRVVGLPLNQSVVLPKISSAEGAPTLTADQAIVQATAHRSELTIAAETYQAARYDVRAARSLNLPSLKATADYGFSGNTPERTARTGSIGGRLDLPILNGGAAVGQTDEALGRRMEAESRWNDIRTQVEEDVRLSLQTLTAEVEEIKTADQAVDLAQREVKMARDRFAAGVDDNIQLLSAQTALDRALDDQVESRARYQTARINFASALGQMETFQ